MQHSRETKLLRLNIKLSYLYHIAFIQCDKARRADKPMGPTSAENYVTGQFSQFLLNVAS